MNETVVSFTGTISRTTFGTLLRDWAELAGAFPNSYDAVFSRN